MVALLVVTLASLLLAAVASAVAWRVVGEERRRSAARVRALSAEIRGEEQTGSAGVFTASDRPSAPARSGAAIALGVFVVGAAAALMVVLSAGSHTAPPAPIGPTAPAIDLPLELVALGHERDGDRLTVRGVVRNPGDAAVVDQLVPVVFVFNQEGGFVASGRGTIDASTLAPGAESAFTVAVPGISDIGRYRVSFRSADRILPHVDRRDGQRQKVGTSK